MLRTPKTDEVTLIHRHDDGEQSMTPVSDDHVDGLRVREYACTCGFGTAVLSKVESEQQGASWPYTMRDAARLD